MERCGWDNSSQCVKGNATVSGNALVSCPEKLSEWIIEYISVYGLERNFYCDARDEYHAVQQFRLGGGLEEIMEIYMKE